MKTISKRLRAVCRGEIRTCLLRKEYFVVAMLSVLGRQVVRNARPATTLSNGQRRGYTLPIDLLEDLSYRGFVHHVTRYALIVLCWHYAITHLQADGTPRSS